MAVKTVCVYYCHIVHILLSIIYDVEETEHKKLKTETIDNGMMRTAYSDWYFFVRFRILGNFEGSVLTRYYRLQGRIVHE